MAPQEQKRLKYICLVANDDGDADDGDGDDDYGDDDDGDDDDDCGDDANGDDNAGSAGAEISNVRQQADGHCKGYQALGSTKCTLLAVTINIIVIMQILLGQIRQMDEVISRFSLIPENRQIPNQTKT